MSIVYPENLPCFLAEYSYAQTNTISSTAFQSGFRRTRRRFKEVPVSFNLSLLLDDEQLATFEAWRYYTLEDVNWFNAQLKTGSGLEDWIIRFTDTSEQKTYDSGYWRLAFTAEARKNRYIDESQTYFNAYGIPYDFGTKTLNAVGQYYL